MKLNKRDRDSLERRGFSYYFSSSLLPFKITKIDKYLFIEFIKSCFGAILFFTFIYEMTQLFMQMDSYLNKPSDFNTIERIMIIHISKLPYNIILFSPLGFLFGTMFTLSNFYKNSEVVTVIGSGVHLFRFTLPILAFSLLYSVFLIFFGEYIMSPLYNTSENLLWEINNRRPIVDYSEGVENLKTSGEGGLNYNNIGYFDPENKLMKNGIVITRNTKDLSGNEIKIASNTNSQDEQSIDINLDPSIKENIDNINNVLNTLEEKSQEDENSSTDRIINVTDTETQEINIDNIFDEGIDTNIEEIYDKDKIPDSEKPNINNQIFELEEEVESNLNEKPDSNTSVNKNNNDIEINDNIDNSNNIQDNVDKEDKRNNQPIEKDIDKNPSKTETNKTKKEKPSQNETKEFTVITENDDEPDLDYEMSITNRRKEYHKKLNSLTNFFNNTDYDDYDYYVSDNPNKDEYNNKNQKNDSENDVEQIQDEVSEDIVNVILGLDYELNGYGTSPINEIDTMGNTNTESDNDDNKTKLNKLKSSRRTEEETNNELNKENTLKNKPEETENERRSVDDIKDINNSLEKDDPNNSTNNDNIDVEDLEKVDIKSPNLNKIKEISQQTYINQQTEKEESVSQSSIGVPIEGQETDNQPVDLTFNEQNNQENDNIEEIDENPIYYYRNLLNYENPFSPNIGRDNSYEGRTIDLRLDAECIAYIEDGWYSKCLSKSGKYVDSEATLWEWDDNGNLLLGYPKDLTGQKINVIKDMPFHFEDNTNTKMDTISFGKGLQIVEKLRKSGKVYKNKQSELYGRKLYFPFASFIITLLGIGLGRFHTKKGVLISTFFFALMFFAAYYVLYQIGESVGSLTTIPIPGYIAPAFGNIVFLAVGAFVIKKSKT